MGLRVDRRQLRRRPVVSGAGRRDNTAAAQAVAAETRALLPCSLKSERVRVRKLNFVSLVPLVDKKIGDCEPNHLPTSDALPSGNGHRLAGPRIAPLRAKAPRRRVP